MSSKNGVAEISFKGLRIVFKTESYRPLDTAHQDGPGLEKAEPEASEAPSSDAGEIVVDADLREGMRRAQLLIDDPMQNEMEEIDALIRQ